ncbi:MAG: thioredoxin-disulfide reductase [Lachnospiraceae bacterium]|nr:thioredoxin-disulfide reductase [Lachnospiraceae bacterium]
MVYDIIIIGSGPAGLTAAIYAKRACLNALLLYDPYAVESQICNTYEVCNYPGFNNVSGQELHDSFKKHAKELNVEMKGEKVTEITDIYLDIKKVKTANAEYETKTIILATGGSPKHGGFEREEEFVGNGVSYCATCDGAFFKNREVAVIGGGDTAVEDAIFLSRIAKKVYLIVRRNELRATKVLQEEVKSEKNVEIFYETVVKEIIGENKIEGILIKGKNDIIMSELTVDGVFVGIGMNPSSMLLKEKVEMDGEYIKADETCETSIKGIYAVGDVRKKQLRQVITACADGANAITSIQNYLATKDAK